MTDPGYRDSPDTTDPRSRPDETAGTDETTLTTDDEAQREDSVTRPGNEPD